MMDLDDPRNPSRIPLGIIDCIQRYVDHGLPPGDFLEAVLSNDLMGACKRGDLQSINALVAIVGYVYNKLPSNIHGSREIVQLWIALGSARRLDAPAEEIDKISEALYETLGRKGS